MNTYLGIDPGISGAVAWIFGSTYGVVDIPVMAASDNGRVRWMVDCAQLANELIDRVPGAFCDCVAALEHVSSMPGQGVASVFSFGDSFGACRGVLSTLGIDVRLVRPAAWKRDLGLGSDKELSLTMAREMFPNAPLDRKKDNNRAEALLLAEWAIHGVNDE